MTCRDIFQATCLCYRRHFSVSFEKQKNMTVRGEPTCGLCTARSWTAVFLSAGLYFVGSGSRCVWARFGEAWRALRLRSALVEDTSSSSLSCRRSDVWSDSRFWSSQCFSSMVQCTRADLLGPSSVLPPWCDTSNRTCCSAEQPRRSALFIPPFDNVRPRRALPELFTS